MIPFEYRTPKNLKEVHATLKEFGTDAKLIAGGTALVIMMKQRLVRPSCLVSLRSVRGLNGIEVMDGGLRIGGLATHREVESSSLVRRRLPLLAETYHHVATIRVRNMATVGGGLAHADPNQDPPPTLIALGATVKATSANGSRVIPLDEFFTDYYETVLKPDEIITEVFIPRLAANSGGAYLKFLPRTADDYGTVSAAAVLTLDKNKKTISDVRIALGSVGVTPIRATAAEAVLRGQPVKAEAFAEAGEKAKEAVDPVSDFRGSAAYKKDMAAVFVRRALDKALASIRQQARAKAAPKTTRKTSKKGKRP
ncbi:MAG: xanthine dehydrogenase family protein subunit M [Deltaproteobacteria bacterium]|nr:xanthine dehydrogenase family protein subunit M [Deltaproteobacteria bacterium]MDZ4341589.1 xanthine dehydrogenase family protein subunit M [Candidatus Binatia bacterium]